MGLFNFLVLCLRFGAEDFCILGVPFVLILIWSDLEWCTACLAVSTACVCVINLFAMYWTASYKLFEVHEFQLYHFMMLYDHLRFI